MNKITGFFSFHLLLGLLQVLMLFHEVYPHSGHSHGSSKRKVVSGKGFLKTAHSDQDTSHLLLNLYGNVNVFLSRSENGINGGEPLGTGGIGPFYYASYLYPYAPFTAIPPTIDTRIDGADFGYIPLWEPIELGIQLRLNAQKRLSFLFDFSLINEYETQNAGTILTPSISQMAFNWRPEILKNFVFKLGHISEDSHYSSIFGQSPMLSLANQGLSLNYRRNQGQKNRYDFTVLCGTNQIERILWGKTGKDNSVIVKLIINDSGDTVIEFTSKDMTPKGFWGENRIRSNVYGQFKYQLGEKLDFHFLTGIQTAPEGSTYKIKMFEIDKYQKYKKGFGWTAGLETRYANKEMEHILAVIYGKGDIEMGWGSPDFVYYRWPLDSFTAVEVNYAQEYFSKNESSLMNIVYWGNVTKRKLKIDWGFWYANHNPGSNPVTWENVNKNAALAAFPDSLVKKLFGYTTASEMPDSVSLDTEDYSTFKFAIDPSFRFNEMISVGLRYDYMRYLNPDAHTNTQEWERDKSLRPYYPDPLLLDKSINGKDTPPLTRPSKWEMQAVNGHIISPYLILNISDLFTLKTVFSFGLYSDEIRKHSEYSNVHSGLNFSTSIYYSFSSGNRMKNTARNISKEEALTRAQEELIKLVREKQIDQSWVSIQPEKVEKKKFVTGKQWVIHFYNDEIEDDEKCDLYIFLTLEGYFDTYNHFGE